MDFCRNGIHELAVRVIVLRPIEYGVAHPANRGDVALKVGVSERRRRGIREHGEKASGALRAEHTIGRSAAAGTNVFVAEYDSTHVLVGYQDSTTRSGVCLFTGVALNSTLAISTISGRATFHLLTFICRPFFLDEPGSRDIRAPQNAQPIR